MAISKLCKHLGILVEHRLKRYGLDPNTRDEIQSAVLLKLGKKESRERFLNSALNKNGTSLRAWIAVVIRNSVRDHFRSKSNRPANLGDAVAWVEAGDFEPDTPLEYFNQIAEQIYEVLPLREEDVDTYVRVTLLNKTRTEVAESLGVSRKTVNNRIYKVRSLMLANLTSLTPKQRLFYEVTLIANEEEFIQLAREKLIKDGHSEEAIESWLSHMYGESVRSIGNRQNATEDEVNSRIARIEDIVVAAFCPEQTPNLSS